MVTLILPEDLLKLCVTIYRITGLFTPAADVMISACKAQGYSHQSNVLLSQLDQLCK